MKCRKNSVYFPFFYCDGDAEYVRFGLRAFCMLSFDWSKSGLSRHSPKEVPFVWAALRLNQNWKNGLIFAIFSRLFLLRLTKHSISLCDLSLFMYYIILCLFHNRNADPPSEPNHHTVISFSSFSGITPSTRPFWMETFSSWNLHIRIQWVYNHKFLCVFAIGSGDGGPHIKESQNLHTKHSALISLSSYPIIHRMNSFPAHFVCFLFSSFLLFLLSSSSFLFFMSSFFLSLPTSTYFLFILKNI